MAYFLIDTLPLELNKNFWKTPKDLIELGELDNYDNLSTFYYRYNEEPKTQIRYVDQVGIDNIIKWLEE